MDAVIRTRSSLIAAYDAAVAACDPEAAVASTISLDHRGVTIGGHLIGAVPPDDIVVVSLGKAASAMARGAASVLGSVRGIAASNHTEPCPIPLVIGSHPVPDSSSLACGDALVDFVSSLAPSDVVLYLISGGGSSIAVAPVSGVTLGDLVHLNNVLLASGVPIREMNEVRAAVSLLKGGRLANMCPAQRDMTLVLSDVVGAGPSHVASGPTLGAGMGRGALDAILRCGLEPLLPESVLVAVGLSVPVSGTVPRPYAVVGSSEVAARAASKHLELLGLQTVIATTDLMGEARTVATGLVRNAVEGSVTIATGETTVKVTGDGIGGRNQEAALAVSIEISGSGVVFAALGTDGIDGATPAAGAVVDGGTADMASAHGVDLDDALTRNDSHTALSAVDAVVVRGDTGTNVGDLWMVAKGLGE